MGTERKSIGRSELPPMMARRAAMPIVRDQKAQQGGRERHLGKRPNCRTRAVIGVSRPAALLAWGRVRKVDR
jgi:hypothetical protein